MGKKAAAHATFAGVTLDLDALCEADAKLMKGVEDWPPFVAYALDWIDKGLVALGKEPIDREAIKSPGEYFDDLVTLVKSTKPTSLKAQFVKAAALMALDYIHKFIHPDHVVTA